MRFMCRMKSDAGAMPTHSFIPLTIGIRRTNGLRPKSINYISPTLPIKFSLAEKLEKLPFVLHRATARRIQETIEEKSPRLLL